MYECQHVPVHQSTSRYMCVFACAYVYQQHVCTLVHMWKLQSTSPDPGVPSAVRQVSFLVTLLDSSRLAGLQLLPVSPVSASLWPQEFWD